jgi:hypothetical protein
LDEWSYRQRKGCSRGCVFDPRDLADVLKVISMLWPQRDEEGVLQYSSARAGPLAVTEMCMADPACKENQ